MPERPLAEQVVLDRMALYGYTADECAAASKRGHTDACYFENWNWVCGDENGRPNHVVLDEMNEVAEFVMWILEHPRVGLVRHTETSPAHQPTEETPA